VTSHLYNTWAETIGGLDGYGPGQSGPTNPWPLLIEYALGTDPATPTLGLLPQITVTNLQQLGAYSFQDLVVSNATNSYLTLDFDFNREAEDIELAVRESSNLPAWTDSLLLQPPYDGSGLTNHPNVVSVVENPADTNSASLTAHITVRGSFPVPARTAGFLTIAVRSTVGSATAPMNLQATDHFGILLEWDGTVEKGVFIVERSPAGVGTFARVGQSDTAQFTDATAVVGQAYDYRVRAVNAAGLSDWSNLVTVTRSV
jgi:hypothetical protein